MKNSSFYKLLLAQVVLALEPFASLTGMSKPPGGWLRSIRESIGRSIRGQAALLGLAPATLQKSEQSEANDRITLGQLRKLASGLDCELVYALVPKQPLQKVVEDRAEFLARRDIMGVSHTMALEDQRPSNSFLERKVAECQQELLSGVWNRLWL